jgi:hypothetical protein
MTDCQCPIWSRHDKDCPWHGFAETPKQTTPVQWHPVVNPGSVGETESKPDGSIIDDAREVVSGDRRRDYGTPREVHTRIGRMWGAILGLPDIAPERVALMMIALKVAREVQTSKRDNRVDMAGYLLCLEEILSGQAGAS